MEKPLIFRNSDFTMLWIGQVLSQAGTRMYQIAIVWWILERVKEHSGTTIGFFLVLGALPAILLVKPIGQLIDRIVSKKLLISCDLLGLLTLLSLWVIFQTGLNAIIVVFFVQLIVSTIQSTIDPTLSKAIPELVEQKDIEKAVAFQTSTQSIANFSGAVLGAFLIDLLGIKGVVLLNALGYFISAICNYIIKYKYLPTKDAQESNSQESAWSLLKEKPWIKKVLIGFGFINFFSTPTLVILPLYTMKTLHGSASLLGTFEASIWAGLITGSFSTKLFRNCSNTLKLGGICLSLLGLCLIFPGFIVNTFLYFGFLLIGHFMLGVNNVRFVSLFQEVVPNHIKGRFFALLQALISFTFPVAFFLFGLLGDHFAPPWLCILQGLGIMVVSTYFLKLAYFSKLGHTFNGDKT